MGVLLAGGQSRRLPGQPKQLLDLGGQPLLQYGVDLMRTAHQIDIVVVALGDDSSSIQRRVDLADCQVVINDAPGDGCGGSITASMAWIRGNVADPAAIVLVPGDQPLLSEAAVSAVLEQALFEQDPIGVAGFDIYVTRYDDGIGHPFLFRPSTFDRLDAVGGDKAAWKLVNDDRFTVGEVRVEGPIPADIDTWDDYDKLSKELTPR